MSEDNYTIKEFITHSMNDLKETVLAIHVDVKETRDQSYKTNGRVTKLEDWSLTAQKIIEGNASAVNVLNADKQKIEGAYKVILAVAIAVPILCTTIFGLYLKVRDNEIDNKIRGVEKLLVIK